MKVGIVGGGSIGLLVSGYLYKEHEVTIYCRRKEQKQKINDDGLFTAESSKPRPVKALLLDELQQEDCLIICVKQSQISTILTKIKMQKTDTPFIFLQNGMGHIELLDMDNPIFVGVVEHGALRKTDNYVQHTGKGLIRLAVFQKGNVHLETLVEQFDQCCFPVQKEADWRRLLHEKLIVNAVINPLTALLHVRNGAIIDNPFINQIAKVLCMEAAMVLKMDFLKQWNRVQSIAENTRKNTSSMLKDIKGKQKTEIEAITGYIINQCDHTSHLPYSTFVYDGIRALEREKEIDQ
ncbi:2-dehydropantoate 2-reductase [Virgibacillus alimentarius]|uniref:2-dehydropantoate 2-reductase n=1 Tax=Virgibacillus alimentarius TaxID=698769 RepID=A0ABS4S6S6_9BACI|nr:MULTISPECIES: 2-dehydropantoate 2-reductase [Virgibacillus]MBP2256102.1 2-dehydropantoate 2-reductase [Virgibacillus alimentarius]HLR66049.1 2-dehydropantoate 2-reductase [Virgibacillus sp.]